jgi:hypothetical protein
MGARKSSVAHELRGHGRTGCRRRHRGNPNARRGERFVEASDETRVPLADQEPERADPVAEVHHQVTGLLNGPGCGGVFDDAEDVHPAEGDLHDDQDVHALYWPRR